jgi:hypothetical protein
MHKLPFSTLAMKFRVQNVCSISNLRKSAALGVPGRQTSGRVNVLHVGSIRAFHRMPSITAYYISRARRARSALVKPDAKGVRNAVVTQLLHSVCKAKFRDKQRIRLRRIGDLILSQLERSRSSGRGELAPVFVAPMAPRVLPTGGGKLQNSTRRGPSPVLCNSFSGSTGQNQSRHTPMEKRLRDVNIGRSWRELPNVKAHPRTLCVSRS